MSQEPKVTFELWDKQIFKTEKIMLSKLLKNVKGQISLRKLGTWITAIATAAPYIASGDYLHAIQVLGGATGVVGLIHSMDK